MTSLLSISKKRASIIALSALVIFNMMIGSGQIAYASNPTEVSLPLSGSILSGLAGLQATVQPSGGTDGRSLAITGVYPSPGGDTTFGDGLWHDGYYGCTGTPGCGFFPDTLDINTDFNGGTGFQSATYEGFFYILFGFGGHIFIQNFYRHADGTMINLSSDSISRIDSVVPANNEVVATSTAVFLQINGWITSADFSAHSPITIKLNWSNNGFKENLSPDVIGAIPDTGAGNCPWYDLFGCGGTNITPVFGSVSFIATTSGRFSFSTSTSLQQIGKYTLNGSLVAPQNSLLGITLSTQNLISNGAAVSTSTIFIVGTSTKFDQLQNQVTQGINDILTNASSTIDIHQVCVPIIGYGFDPIACMVAMIDPNPSGLNYDVNLLYNNLLTRAPWGYVTRFQQIMSTTSSSTLPAYTIHINTASTSSTTLSFDMQDMIVGGGTLLDSIRDPRYNLNARDVFTPIVDLVVYSAVLFTIVSDLLGSHRHHVQNSNQSKGKLS